MVLASVLGLNQLRAQGERLVGGRSKSKVWSETCPQKEVLPTDISVPNIQVDEWATSNLGTAKDFAKGESSVTANTLKKIAYALVETEVKSNTNSEAEVDSSDVPSTDSEEEEEGQIVENVRNGKKRVVLQQSGTRGKGPKH